jgi:hypothetical protein
VGSATLPAGHSGGAAAASPAGAIFAGGLSDAGVSTATVVHVDRHGAAQTVTPLPSPIHDAAAAPLGKRLLVFGGGVSEGSDRIVQLLPGRPHLVATLPQALSDLVAAEIGNVDYVTGGWNGVSTNRAIYAVRPAGAQAAAGAGSRAGAGPGAGTEGNRLQVRQVGTLPVGVRYPAATELAGKLLIAGGEQTSGDPTARTWSFDPATCQVARLPSLPAPIDHAAGVAFDARFYVIGGLRRGTLSRAILSWAPGERRWRSGGRLPDSLADASAVSLGGVVAVLGGRHQGGRVRSITLMTAG